MASQRSTEQTMTPRHPQWQQFTNGLANAVHARGCDHTHEHTRALLEVLTFTDEETEASVTSFAEAGGFCDCEILVNLAAPASEPAKGKTAYQAGLMNAGATLLTGFTQMYGSGMFGGGAGGSGVGRGGSGAFSGSLARASVR